MCLPLMCADPCPCRLKLMLSCVSIPACVSQAFFHNSHSINVFVLFVSQVLIAPHCKRKDQTGSPCALWSCPPNPSKNAAAHTHTHKCVCSLCLTGAHCSTLQTKRSNRFSLCSLELPPEPIQECSSTSSTSSTSSSVNGTAGNNVSGGSQAISLTKGVDETCGGGAGNEQSDKGRRSTCSSSSGETGSRVYSPVRSSSVSSSSRGCSGEGQLVGAAGRLCVSGCR